MSRVFVSTLYESAVHVVVSKARYVNINIKDSICFSRDPIFIQNKNWSIMISITAEFCYEIFSKKVIVYSPYYEWVLVNNLSKKECHFFHQQQHTSHHQDPVKIHLGYFHKFLWTQLFTLSWFLTSIQHCLKQ